MGTGRQAGNINDRIDRDLLHQYLWRHADPRTKKVGLTQTELGERLGVSIYTMSRIFSEMLTSGRLRRMRNVYYVIDPELWKWRNPTPPVPDVRVRGRRRRRG